jgi:hypothetical protein
MHNPDGSVIEYVSVPLKEASLDYQPKSDRSNSGYQEIMINPAQIQ